MKHFKNLLIFCGLFSVFSCQNDDPINENDKVLNYLLQNGFHIEKGNAFPENSRLKIASLEEAMNFVKAMQLTMVFEEDINLRKDTKSPSNISRSSIYECNEPGTFYLSRAVNGLISGVDVSFSRDSNGNIYDVNSFATGLVVGWSWLQSSVLYNPNHYFCIQSLTTYGISAANITLGYTALVRITVQIKGCDVTTVNSAYGHC